MIKYLFILLIGCSLQSAAQINDTPVKLAHYVFPAFTEGMVKMKSGEITRQKLNYNLVTKEMIFEQGSDYLAIAHPEQVDTVLIDGREFIPVNNAFYEWLGGTAYPFYIEHTCTVKEQGASTGFGTTNTTAASSVKSLQKDGGAYKLKLPDDFTVIPGHSFYILKDGKYSKVSGEQQLVKLFPDKKEIIKDWVKAHHTSFSKQEDMLLLINQIQ